jgi:hypothetical protein
VIYLTIKGVGHRMPVDNAVKDDRDKAAQLIGNSVRLSPNRKTRKKKS